MSKILAPKALIVRTESKISKIFESLTLWFEGWNRMVWRQETHGFEGWKRMVWRLETHGLEAENAWFGGRSVAVGCAKVALWLCESGTLGVRKWHIGDVEVALPGG